ncbi:unnamed protein product [Rhizophagus irregularis]|uniref:Uncharacterized protein n=1 Tax=Rhizophagus irregularis TaxID=588596 RepID=A0A916EKW6_9GLOM|nr:unnamed protein product [Rhizophagus irregularis]CAB5395202.1 unnamed protein product [Rhizophagus irregularis]
MSLEWNEEQTRFLIDERKTGAQQHPNTITPSSSPNTPSRRQPSRIPRSPNKSRLITPSISRPPSSGSRPVTPSFFQSAETINIYINYNEPDRE